VCATCTPTSNGERQIFFKEEVKSHVAAQLSLSNRLRDFFIDFRSGISAEIVSDREFEFGSSWFGSGQRAEAPTLQYVSSVRLIDRKSSATHMRRLRRMVVSSSVQKPGPSIRINSMEDLSRSMKVGQRARDKDAARRVGGIVVVV
jgi:hypothetical protein